MNNNTRRLLVDHDQLSNSVSYFKSKRDALMGHINAIQGHVDSIPNGWKSNTTYQFVDTGQQIVNGLKNGVCNGLDNHIHSLHQSLNKYAEHEEATRSMVNRIDTAPITGGNISGNL